MSSWYSGILTKTTTQISNFQSRVFQGENDGDTEDDTHVCRTLRAYYTEKGRPFPGWLPPDPKAPPPAAPVYAQPQVGSRYGSMGQQGGAPAGSLSSLWDNNAQPQRQEAPQSLRQGRMGSQQAGARLSPFSQQQQQGADQGRPPPGQRAGSYQTSSPYGRDSGGTPAPAPGGGSAQDRLKQRLWGGTRTTSPSNGGGGGGQGPFQPPARGGGGSGDYEDRFAPGGMYDSGPRGGGGGGGGGRPYGGANSPWSGADDGSSNYSGGGGGGSRGRPTGLPSGPRMGGLPSNPRAR